MKSITLWFLLMLALSHTILCIAQEQTWVEIGGEIYGARAYSQDPIGGGAGYARVITGGDFIVTTLDSLLEALSKAKPGQIVFIPGDVELDLTPRIYIDKLELKVTKGVTLASDRGYNGSSGALLVSAALDTSALISIHGPDVRISGLRIQGPTPKRYGEHHARSFNPDGKGRDYYNRFPVSSGIISRFPGVEVDNCEISGFAYGCVNLINGDRNHVHHNFIHHCQYSGLGYGVVLGKSSALIEYNIFNWNRHSIAGTGKPQCSYVARHNVELGESLSHVFDMHGGRDRGDGTDVAGSTIEIYNNTFNSRKYPVVIRGEPRDKAVVYNNWFVNRPLEKPAVSASKKTEVKNNIYGDPPTLQLQQPLM